MAAGLGEIKQKKSSCGSVRNNTFVLFYSPTRLGTKYEFKNIEVNLLAESGNGFSVLKSVCRLRLKKTYMESFLSPEGVQAKV